MKLKESEDVQKALSELREWFKTQQQFPQDIEDRLLIRFLHSCYYDVERTKSVLKLFFHVRTSLSEVLCNRDPLSPEMQTSFSINEFAQLHVAGNKNIWIYHLNDPGFKKYDYIDTVKLSFLQTDTWLLENDVLEDEDIVIIDVRDVGFKLLTKINIAIEKIFNKYLQEAFPVRLKQVHLVNVPSFFSMVYSFIKPFLNNDVKEKINFHSPNSNTIFNFLNKDDLPEEYGGNNGKMAEHSKNVIDGIVRNREYLLKYNLWTEIEDNSVTEETSAKQSADVNQAVRTIVGE